MEKSKEEPVVQVVDTKIQKPKPEVKPSANPETSGWDELDKITEEPVVQVVETKIPKPKSEIRPSANSETSGWDALDKSNTEESPSTNQMKQTGQLTSPNFLPEIAERMKKTLIIAGRKLEAGEFNDFEKLIRQLASYSEDVANTDLQTYASELAEMIENTNAQRRSSLLAMRTKIHSLNQYIGK